MRSLESRLRSSAALKASPRLRRGKGSRGPNKCSGEKISEGLRRSSNNIGHRTKGRTYEEIYGDRAEAELRKRRDAHRARHPNGQVAPHSHSDAQYAEWRRAVLKRDGWLCRRCPSRSELHAHHIKSWAEFPAFRYVVDNGLTLCKDCHKFEHRQIREQRARPAA